MCDMVVLIAASICLHRSSSWAFRVVLSSWVLKVFVYVARSLGGQVGLGVFNVFLRILLLIVWLVAGRVIVLLNCVVLWSDPKSMWRLDSQSRTVFQNLRDTIM